MEILSSYRLFTSSVVNKRFDPATPQKEWFKACDCAHARHLFSSLTRLPQIHCCSSEIVCGLCEGTCHDIVTLKMVQLWFPDVVRLHFLSWRDLWRWNTAEDRFSVIFQDLSSTSDMWTDMSERPTGQMEHLTTEHFMIKSMHFYT
jgi:hypothetical protein